MHIESRSRSSIAAHDSVVRSMLVAGMLVAGMLVAVWAAAEAHAAPASSVRLEIVQDAGVPLEAPQQWLRDLDGLGLGAIRIRAARPGDAAHVEQQGQGRSATFRVVAILNRRGELELPERVRLRRGDVGRLKDWLTQLGAAGDAGGALADQTFGLSETELVDLFDQLSVAVEAPTLGGARADTLRRVAKLAGIRLELRPELRGVITRSAPVEDELKGVAVGTAIAALLRPLDLVAEPKKTSRGIVIRIRPSAQVAEAWPIGWPPEGNDGEALPVLLERFPIQISDTPLPKAMAALQQRLAVPILYDHAGMKAKRINLDEIKINFPASRTFYKRVLTRILFQARLEMEVRHDEGRRPFLWVRPIQLNR